MTQQRKPAQRRAQDVPEGDEPQSADQRRGKTKASGAVSPIVARQIDENLKRLYHQQVEEDLPPALQALVARLRDGNVTPGRDDEGSS